MTTMTADQIETLVRPYLEKAGLVVVRIEVEGQEAPENHLPVVNAYVGLAGTNGRELSKKLMDAAIDLSNELGHDVEYGYFELDVDGRDNSEALLEISDFPFTLDPEPTPSPR